MVFSQALQAILCLLKFEARAVGPFSLSSALSSPDPDNPPSLPHSHRVTQPPLPAG